MKTRMSSNSSSIKVITNKLGFVGNIIILMRSHSFLLLLFLFACNQKDGFLQEEELIMLSANISDRQIELSELISTIEYVPLEESSHSLVVPRFHSAVFYEEYMLLLPLGPSMNRILVYGKDGRYMQTIKSTGMGPLGFNKISSFAKKNEKELLISDLTKRTIYTVSVPEFVVTKELKVDFSITGIYFQDDLTLALTYENEAGMLRVLDTEMNIVKSAINYPADVYNLIPGRSPFSAWENSVLLNATLSDTIYRIFPSSNIEAYAKIGDINSTIVGLNDTDDIDFHLFDKRDITFSAESSFLFPYGFLTTYMNFSFIPLLNTRCLLWNMETNSSVLIDASSIKDYSLIHDGFIKSLNSENSSEIITTIVLTHTFYENAMKYVDKNNNHISHELQELLTKYPKGTSFENPILVKSVWNVDALEKLLE
ncbi:MAG: hypothetical protein ACI9FN_001602 [Saprospiraceae bacterium]|jgi:hypothetical protein